MDLQDKKNKASTLDRQVIGIFGRPNVGKSSLLNALTGQDIAIVSPVSGTTTDPVIKHMELSPIGPVSFIDTAGIGDGTSLSDARDEKTREQLRRSDLVILVTDMESGLDPSELLFLGGIDREIPIILFRNNFNASKSVSLVQELPPPLEDLTSISGNPLTMDGIDSLKEFIATKLKSPTRRLIADLLEPGDLVILVTPIDAGAPKGRLILPQQQTIREILDAHAMAITVQTEELAFTLKQLKFKPKLIVTDSQVFKQVSAIVPKDIPLLSFSILFSRLKGDLKSQADAALKINELSANDLILIAEGCTHHRQCDDIGTVKLPRMLSQKTSHELRFDSTQGGQFPRELDPYKLILHCGACMLNTREMQNRLHLAANSGVAITNFGLAIAHMTGILERCLDGLATLERGTTWNQSI